jgi:hypothetical protein
VVSYNDFLPFGSTMIGRTFSSEKYRYSFNTQEKTDEISGSGNHTTADFWEYDPRLGRRWNLDPIPYPWLSSYSAFDNNPIYFTDHLGLSPNHPGKGNIFQRIYQRIFKRTSSRLKLGKKVERNKVIVRPPRREIIIDFEGDPTVTIGRDGFIYKDINLDYDWIKRFSYNQNTLKVGFDFDQMRENEEISILRRRALNADDKKTIFEVKLGLLSTDFIRNRRFLSSNMNDAFTVRYHQLLKADPSLINSQFDQFDNLSVTTFSDNGAVSVSRSFRLRFLMKLSDAEIEVKEKQGNTVEKP